MSQPPSIPYRSGPIAVRAASPSEFDHAYEQERGRWLRRRFLYYTGSTLVIGLIFAVPTVWIVLSHRRSDVAWWHVATMLLSNAVYLAAFVVAWRSRPIYARVLSVALVTYILASLLGIGFTHLYYVTSADDFQAGVLQSIEVDTDKPASRPLLRIDRATRPTVQNELFGGGLRHSYIEPATTQLGSMRPTATLPWALDNLLYGVVWASLLLSLAFNHLFISLFLPWTVRDSLRPAVVIASAFLFMVLVDAIIGVAWWPFALAASAILPVSFVPGTVVCWWRYSRFNKQFRQQFESAGFKKFQEEMVGARRIHEANLPAPILDGPIRVAYEYEPMREIGGDLLMLHRSPSGSAVSAVLFDVTGHGISAALSVHRIVGEIERTFAEDADASPERVVQNLNRYVCATLARHQVFATAIVAQIDSDSGKRRYVNAGHPAAVLFREADGSVSELHSTAMMLGVCVGEEFECVMLRTDFAVGDAVVLYTDGASEAADPQGKMLGHGGTFQVIYGVAREHGDPAHWPIALRDRIVAHRQSPPTDDTLIVSIWRA